MEPHRDNADDVEPETGEGRPVCLRCLTPFDPLQHYCDKCGETVGQLSPYIPFVNIRFNYGMVGRLWKLVWFDKRPSFIKRLFYLLLIVMFAPVMLVGLPFVLWRKIRSRSTVE